MGRNQYSAGEAGSVALGQGGSLFEDSTSAVTANVVAIQFITDSKFTTLTPRNSTFIGTAGGNGDAIVNTDIFPAGMTIYGDWTAFTLADGSVIAYLG